MTLKAGIGALETLLSNGLEASPGAAVLAYHDIVASGAKGYEVDVHQFERHLRLLHRLGLEAVTAGELIDRLAAEESVDRCVVVTFDDGLAGIHGLARRVLASEGVRATIFMVSDSPGCPPAWWPGQDRSLTTDELVDLAEDGHELASHTRTHPSLVEVSTAQLFDELSESRRDIHERFGQPADLLAYPSGHHDATVRKAAVDAGYRAAFTFLNGRIRGGEDLFRLPRLTMGSHHSVPRLAYQLLRTSGSWPDHQLDAVPGD